MRGPTVILVHGAWCGDWVYWKLAPCLEARGLTWLGADLPSCRAEADASLGVADDVEHVRGLLDRADGPIVLLGKSYGGTVITGASVDRSDVAHLLYVAAMMPAAGEDLQTMTMASMTPEFAQGLRFGDDGRLAIDPEVGAELAFTQASDEDKDVWRREGTAMSIGGSPSSFEHVGWEQIPSTYVVCTEDLAIQPAVQRTWAAQATHVVERPWDHSPGVSHPEDVADLVAHVAGSIG